MLYYRVKKSADQYPKNRCNPSDIYIANELYTVGEVEQQGLDMRYLDPVEVSKCNVYFSFGARFELGNNFRS